MYGVIFIAMGWLKLVVARPPLLSTSTPFWRSRPNFGGRFLVVAFMSAENIGRKEKSVSQNSEAVAVTRRLAPSFLKIGRPTKTPLKVSVMKDSPVV